MIIRQKIAVTGASGQLGQALVRLSENFPQYQFLFLSSDDLDIREKGALNHFFTQNTPQYFINCAAYTAVDKAEEEKDLAFEINANAVKTIAALCHEYDSRLIHISTDYVFDGETEQPYTEASLPNPLNVYGASKLEGEKNILNVNPAAIIIRTSWVYAETGKNFVRTMIRLMQEKTELKIVNDQVGSPTYAGDLALVIMQIITGGNWVPGIFHFSNDGLISWFEFATAIKELTGADCTLLPVPSQEYKTPAWRPRFASLDKARIQSVYGVKLREWKEALKECLSHLDARS